VPIADRVSLKPNDPLDDANESRNGVPDEPLINQKQLASWLSVSPNTMRQWVARGPEAGLVPRMIRVNGQVRFRPRDVRAWLIEHEL
jgi:hypothetical protein